MNKIVSEELAHLPNVAVFKLDTCSYGKGLRCDSTGLFFAGEPLLERDSEGRFRPRPSATIKSVLSRSKLVDVYLESNVRSVNVVATALNDGQIANAMIAAVLMRLAEPDDNISGTTVDRELGKAGYDPAEPRDERGRWARDGSSSSTAQNNVREAFLEPYVEPLIEPLLEPEPEVLPPRALPPRIDIVPPIMGPKRIRPAPPIRLENPFPEDRECVEEWKYALKTCTELERKGKLKWDDSRRYSISFAQCVGGLISERCGGSQKSLGYPAEIG